MAMELVGNGVKLVGADELVLQAASGTAAAVSGRASQAFTASFTKNYATLASRSPVYAELRNLIDLAVAAAYIQQQDFCRKADWKMDIFGNERQFPVQTYNVPKHVASTVAAIWRGNHLMTPIGGGVQIQPLMAVTPENLLPDEDGEVANLRDRLKVHSARRQMVVGLGKCLARCPPWQCYGCCAGEFAGRGNRVDGCGTRSAAVR